MGAQERAERARVAREELVQALAEESASGVGSGPAGDAEAGPEAGGADVGFDERPPRWLTLWGERTGR